MKLVVHVVVVLASLCAGLGTSAAFAQSVADWNDAQRQLVLDIRARYVPSAFASLEFCYMAYGGSFTARPAAVLEPSESFAWPVPMSGAAPWYGVMFSSSDCDNVPSASHIGSYWTALGLPGITPYVSLPVFSGCAPLVAMRWSLYGAASRYGLAAGGVPVLSVESSVRVWVGSVASSYGCQDVVGDPPAATYIENSGNGLDGCAVLSDGRVSDDGVVDYGFSGLHPGGFGAIGSEVGASVAGFGEFDDYESVSRELRPGNSHVVGFGPDRTTVNSLRTCEFGRRFVNFEVPFDSVGMAADPPHVSALCVGVCGPGSLVLRLQDPDAEDRYRDWSWGAAVGRLAICWVTSLTSAEDREMIEAASEDPSVSRSWLGLAWSFVAGIPGAVVEQVVDVAAGVGRWIEWAVVAAGCMGWRFVAPDTAKLGVLILGGADGGQCDFGGVHATTIAVGQVGFSTSLESQDASGLTCRSVGVFRWPLLLVTQDVVLSCRGPLFPVREVAGAVSVLPPVVLTAAADALPKLEFLSPEALAEFDEFYPLSVCEGTWLHEAGDRLRSFLTGAVLLGMFFAMLGVYWAVPNVIRGEGLVLDRPRDIEAPHRKELGPPPRKELGPSARKELGR